MDPVTGAGMSDVISALVSALPASAFFTVVKDLVPFIALLVPVSLAVYFLRKLVKGAGHAKLRI